jgi:hypothetical protein
VRVPNIRKDAAKTNTGAVHRHAETGEAQEAEKHQQPQAQPEGRPVLRQMPPSQQQKHGYNKRPAHTRKQHGRHMAYGQLAGDGVAGPEQHGRQQEDVGLSMHGLTCPFSPHRD